MKTTVQPAPVAMKKRSAYRRLLLATVLLLFGSIAGWMIWGAIRDWADAKALQDYFTELEAREPGWQDRVYGKALTPAQLDDHQKWNELQEALSMNNVAWSPFRQGLHQGMNQDPAQPTAQVPAEQVEFMKAAHEFLQPVLQKLATMGRLPGRHRLVDRNATYEKMLSTFGNMYDPTAQLLNEAVELEVMYHIMMNDPEQAFRWITGCRPPISGYLYSPPSLIERWLNLTQPQAATLLQMQQLLEQQGRWPEKYAFPGLGSDLRLMEKHIRELAHGDLPIAQIDRLGGQFGLVGRDSPWNTQFLGWLRPHYVKYRVGSIFQRPNHLILRLHQLADQVEELARIEPARQWTTWTQFAQSQSILIDRINYRVGTTLKTYPDTMPEGLFHLRANYLHWQMISLFDQQAQMNTTLAAVVAERYRLDHGRFPADWSELVPRYITQPIIDPYTGKPLQIKLNEKGIVIYSIGHQGKDEGGENLSENHSWQHGGKGWDYKKTNLGTRVYLPALRHGPVIELESYQKEALIENTKELLKLMKEGKQEK